MFYELAPFTWGGAVWGVKPISQHLRMIPDFASFRGFLVLGGNQVSSIFDNNWYAARALHLLLCFPRTHLHVAGSRGRVNRVSGLVRLMICGALENLKGGGDLGATTPLARERHRIRTS